MKPNLLFFCSDFVVGLTQALTEQAEELNKSNEINLYCISSENEQEKGLHQRIINAEIDMTIIPQLDVHKGFISLANKISKIITDKKITHVNVHNNWQLALIVWIKYKKIIPAKFKIIYTIHGYRHNSSIKQIPAILMIGGGLLLFADRVISMSTYVTNKFSLLKYKTDLVYYMMNQEPFQKEENNIDCDSLRMVFPAQFRHGKQQDMLIKAVYEYVNTTGDRNIRLTLPGDGPTLQEMKDLVVSLGLQDIVSFPGKLNLKQVWDLYEQANIGVVSSNVETYGRCIAEPYALGRCVITQPTGVALDIIEHGKTGYIYRTAEELADILYYLYTNKEQIAKVANNAFAEKDIFSPTVVSKRYIESIKKA